MTSGTLLNYIAKRTTKNAEHLRPMIKRLAAKGADFNAKEFHYGNTPIIWAIANAHYDLANLLIEIGSKHKAKFNLQGGGNNAVHLLLAKGYQTVSSSDQRFREVSGTILLRHLLALSPDSINDPNGHGYTPLHIAALRRDIGFCQILLELGANAFAKGPNGEIPLELLDKTHEEASEILKSITAAFALPEDCFKSEFAPQVVEGIRRIFPPTTQLEVAFRLRDALEHDTPDLDPLFQMLDPKYRKGIKTVGDLQKKIGAIIQSVSDEQES